jgi:hypothetical protein
VVTSVSNAKGYVYSFPGLGARYRLVGTAKQQQSCSVDQTRSLRNADLHRGEFSHPVAAPSHRALCCAPRNQF